MKRYKNKNITNVLAFTLSLGALVACQDELLYPKDEGFQYDSNMMLFEAYIGSTGVATRSQEMPTDLDPLVLTGGARPLYLHTYVCNNSFDPAYVDVTPTTRGEQVNDMASFVKVHGDKFGVHVRHIDKDEDYVAPTETVKLSQDDSEDNNHAVWRAKGSTVYWPSNSAMMSVHAWAPYDLSSTGLVDGTLSKARGKFTFSYEAQRSASGKNDAESQKDVLFAVTEANKKTYSNNGRAELEFTHPLSAIKFAVRDVLGGTIKSIKLTNILSKGDCTYQLTKDGDYYTDSDSGTYEWTNQSAPTSFMQEFNVTVPTLGYDEYGNPINGDGRDDDFDYSITDRKPEATFMMIPQIISENAEIEIVLTQDQFPEKGDITLKGKIRDNDITEWLPGKEYVYTISTSSENWTYVFNVSGSNQDPNVDNPKDGAFSDDDSNIAVNYTVTEGAYYHVQSYRYRTNNPLVKEPVEWTGTVQDEDGQNMAYGINKSDNANIQNLINKYDKNNSANLGPNLEGIQMTYTPEEWLLNESFVRDTNGDGIKDSFTDVGSIENKKYDVVFKSQYIATDWEGDWIMRATRAEAGNDKAHPIDLSKRNGGLQKRNTANCYVVNKTGWYAIPLYYGNTVTNDAEISTPYIYNGGVAHKEHVCSDIPNGYESLTHFVDYQNKPITKAKIEGANDATLVWMDAYNIISQDEVELRTIEGEPYVVFHIIQEDLQQSNGIVAVRDSNGNIIWSWHVWVSEYMVDDNLVLNRNLVDCDTWVDEFHEGETIPVNSFTVAPRNLGWCDAKNVGYLKRVGKIKFEQNRPNKETVATTEYTHSLNLLQRNHLIEYWIGNNTYYQWGRKDPMVGFVNNLHQIKENYGPKEYAYGIEDANARKVTINYSIQNPNKLCIRLLLTLDSNDWLSEGKNYYNLWNNYKGAGDLTRPNPKDGTTSWAETDQPNTPIHNTTFAYSAVKTVYDPSPAGFVVPPSTFFNVFVKGRVRGNYSNAPGTDISSFNGYRQQMTNIKEGQHTDWFYTWHAYSKKDGSGEAVYFTPTGQRWDRAYHQGLNLKPGENMNAWIVYLWTNVTEFTEAPINSNGLTAFSFALGTEQDCVNNNVTTPYVMTTHFNGRKSMARPVRCVKEYDCNF